MSLKHEYEYSESSITMFACHCSRQMVFFFASSILDKWRCSSNLKNKQQKTSNKRKKYNRRTSSKGYIVKWLLVVSCQHTIPFFSTLHYNTYFVCKMSNGFLLGCVRHEKGPLQYSVYTHRVQPIAPLYTYSRLYMLKTCWNTTAKSTGKLYFNKLCLIF